MIIPEKLVGTLKKQYTKTLSADGQKSWEFPKAHATSHAIDDIQQKGALVHVSTKPGETHHGKYRKIYLASNKKNVDAKIKSQYDIFKDFRQKTLHFLKTVYGLTTTLPSAENVRFTYS